MVPTPEQEGMVLDGKPMIRAFLIALTGCILLSVSAHAEVSKDLTFCASLASSKERLACYDAAVRIQRQEISTAPPPVETTGSPSALAQTPPSLSQHTPSNGKAGFLCWLKWNLRFSSIALVRSKLWSEYWQT